MPEPTELPPELHAALLQAATEYQAGRFDAARQQCLALRRTYPDNLDALHLLGLVEVFAGDTEQGIRLLREAIDRAPRGAQLRVNLGAALMRLDRFEEACEAFLAGWKLQPDADTAFLGAARALSRVTERDTALGKAACAPVRAALSPSRRISAVVCSANDGKARRIRALYERLLGIHAAEIVVMRDAASLCEAFNRGVAATTGDVVIFSHDDIDILTPDFATRLLERLATCDLVGLVGTSRLLTPSWIDAGLPHIHGSIVHRAAVGQPYIFECFGPPPTQPNIQALDGVFMATTREVCAAVPFDAQTFTGFHAYDVDFSYRVHRAGLRVGICWDILVVHESLGAFEAPWQREAEKFRRKHGFSPVTNTRVPLWTTSKFTHEAEVRDYHRRLNEMFSG